MLKNISPKEAKEMLDSGTFALLDTREPSEYSVSHLPGSELVPPSEIQEKLPTLSHTDKIILYCASGRRSAQAGEEMIAAGYKHIWNITGGIEAWKEAGLPVVSELSASQTERYSRQMLLPEIGVAGQKKLLASSVLVVGTGGLGSPLALYLAAGGIGRIGIVDADLVETSNLQRQVIHSTKTVGQKKVASAAKAIGNLNKDVRVETYPERINSENAEKILAGWDVVVDGSDNFQTRYLLAEKTRQFGQPLVSAAILGFHGQISTWMPDEACYRCLFPVPPPRELAPACSENGILGSVAGVMGLLQANEVFKILLGIGQTLSGRLLLVDLLDTGFQELPIHRDPHCSLCGDGQEELVLEGANSCYY